VWCEQVPIWKKKGPLTQLEREKIDSMASLHPRPCPPVLCPHAQLCVPWEAFGASVFVVGKTCCALTKSRGCRAVSFAHAHASLSALPTCACACFAVSTAELIAHCSALCVVAARVFMPPCDRLPRICMSCLASACADEQGKKAMTMRQRRALNLPRPPPRK
jgi:hypothetical protein